MKLYRDITLSLGAASDMFVLSAALFIVYFAAGAGAIWAQTTAQDEQAATSYVLGPDDQISVTLRDVKEIEFKPVRVNSMGDVQLHYAGKVHAAGLTVDELAGAIAVRLREYVNEPNVTVEVTEYGSQPVSVLGGVNKPGVYQLHGRKTLVEVLAMAEGLRSDAGHIIQITRSIEWGKLPLPGAKKDSSGQFSMAELSTAAIMHSQTAGANILMRPHDVISVPRAELVYVVGAVRKPGGFVLGEKEWLTVLQALSMAEGLAPASAAQSAKIIRTDDDSKRTEIPVNIKNVLTSKEPDQHLVANDILFIPNSAAKGVAARSIEAAIQMATGVVIFRRD